MHTASPREHGYRSIDRRNKDCKRGQGNGFAQIMNNRATMLVDTAEQLRQKQSNQQYSHSEASLARALSRLRLKSKYSD